MTPLLFSFLVGATSMSAPVVRATLAPVESDGVDIDVMFVTGLVVTSPLISVESASCATRASCREEGGRLGRDHLLVTRVRRLADHATITLSLLDANDHVIAEVIEAVPLEGIARAAKPLVARLVSRAELVITQQRDPDGDGVIGDQDLCPTVQGTATGCPDRDADGIADASDRCPHLAGVAGRDGCPEPGSPPDQPLPLDAGPEWGRISLGAVSSLFGTAVGLAAGGGLAHVTLIATNRSAPTGGTSSTFFAAAYGSGAALGALVGHLAPDITGAGLCDYPLSAHGLTRLTSSVLVAGLAGAGGGVFGVAWDRGDSSLLPAAIAFAGAAPVVGAISTGAGNCISGPPDVSAWVLTR